MRVLLESVSWHTRGIICSVRAVQFHSGLHRPRMSLRSSHVYGALMESDSGFQNQAGIKSMQGKSVNSIFCPSWNQATKLPAWDQAIVLCGRAKTAERDLSQPGIKLMLTVKCVHHRRAICARSITVIEFSKTVFVCSLPISHCFVAVFVFFFVFKETGVTENVIPPVPCAV